MMNTEKVKRADHHCIIKIPICHKKYPVRPELEDGKQGADAFFVAFLMWLDQEGIRSYRDFTYDWMLTESYNERHRLEPVTYLCLDVIDVTVADRILKQWG